MDLPTDIKASLRTDVNLSSYSTMQVGGLAKYFSDPNTEQELKELLIFASEENIPYTILGKGSNVIFPDKGYAGLVISLLHYEQDFIQVDKDLKTLTASSGIHLYRLVLAARDSGLGGAEFLCNVPGTLGGALYMNAGFSRYAGQKNEIGDLVESVNILTAEGEKRTLPREELDFSYRSSNLRDCIILSGTLQLWRRPKDFIAKEIRANFDYRNSRQDLKHPSSGSIFKNPGSPHPAAGALIEQLGLKGRKIGGAQVSERHSNYIINTGTAKSSDIVQLIHEIQKVVFDATGIQLETEVRIIEEN